MKPIIELPIIDPDDLTFRVEIHLTLPNVALQTRFGYPNLLTSGVRYKREPEGKEAWWCLDQIFDEGYGDCEDLAAAYAAQRRVWAARQRIRNFGASVIVDVVRPGLRHARVRESYNGRITIIDPSKILGMGGEG